MYTPRMETSAPLLRPWQSDSRPATLTRLLSRTSSRRGASMLVRETAARQLEERRANLTYSKPVVALDILWNLAFVVASVVTLISSVKEKPNMPLRAWICVYAALCLFHVALVWWEYRSRNTRRVRDLEAYLEYSGESEVDDGVGGLGINNRESVAKKCEYTSSMVSLLWWMVGFYWVVTEHEFLQQSAPHLYWLVVVFLGFDVFFTIFVLVLACLIAIALCCCLPCIIAILYAVAGQEGATDADINTLPKYNFQVCKDEGKPTTVGAGRMVLIETNSGHLAGERTVFCEDAECCICLSQYEDGTELNSLPCNHHFHSTCVVKWLKMNATCPLCKYNILRGNEES